MKQTMVPVLVVPGSAAWDRPTPTFLKPRKHQSTIVSGTRPTSGADAGATAEPSSTLAFQLGQFCIALALWIAPGLPLMRSDLRAVAEALIANPLQYVPATTVMLAFALAYVFATGLLIVATASRLTKRRPLHVKVCVLLVAAPAILLSLAFTLVSSLAFFLSLTIWCFPVLL